MDCRTIARVESSKGLNRNQVLSFHVISLFPELIESYCLTSIVGRGVRAGKIAVKTYNPRTWCTDRYRKVDDTPYGGGAGMVLKPEPIFAAFESIERKAGSPVVLLTPQGVPFKEQTARDLSAHEDITLICGHYEGFDERICTLATLELSLGDFVMTGGELAALAVIDAVGRLIPGVLGKSISLAHESFEDGLLEAPQFTKPPVFREMAVPDVLKSGDHKVIARWRRQQSLKRTLERRPDLLEHAPLTNEDRNYLQSLKDESEHF